MPDIAFQVLVRGSNLVAVTFPTSGGDSLVEKIWELEKLRLKSTGNNPPQPEVPNGKIAGSEKTSLKIEINYNNDTIRVIPVNRMDNPIEEFAILYDFEELGLEHDSENIKPTQDKKILHASRERPPLRKDKKWTG